MAMNIFFNGLVTICHGGSGLLPEVLVGVDANGKSANVYFNPGFLHSCSLCLPHFWNLKVLIVRGFDIVQFDE